MPTRQNTNFPRLKSDEEFENLILELCRLEWHDPLASDRHGRSGQSQDGVDIYGHPDGESEIHYGAQCKLKTGDKQPTVDDIEMEVEKAKRFSPALKSLIIVTDAPRDVNTQKTIRFISEREIQSGKFSVSIWFWDSICQRIEAYPVLIIKYFHDYFSMLTTAPEAELLINIPLHILSFHSEDDISNTFLDESLELRGIQVNSREEMFSSIKISPDGIIFQNYKNDKSKITLFAGLVLKYSGYNCPGFVVLPRDLHEYFCDVFGGMGGSISKIGLLDANSPINQLASNLFGMIFKNGYGRRGSLTTLDLSIRSAPIRAHKVFLDINWYSRVGPSHFQNSGSWETVLLPALEDVHYQIAALGETTLIQMRPVIQLPVAFAWGFVFNIRFSRIAVWARETGKSELEQQRWVSDSPSSPLELAQEWLMPLSSESRSVLIELSNGRDIHNSVAVFADQIGLGIDSWMQIGHKSTDPRLINIDQGCAVAFAEQVGQIIRHIRQSGVTDIHLFLAMPSSLAVLLGQRLQACGRIHLYWYTNPTYQYAFTLH